MSMSGSPSPVLWSTVAALPDYLLLAQTVQLARHEQALQILVLDHLREIEARRLHLTRGYGSLFDYVVHELGYTAAAAWRRIKAMRLCSRTNGARELLQDGSLNLSNAAQLQNLFERSDRSHGRPPGSDGAGGSLGGAPRSGAAPGEPAPAAPTRGGERDPAPPAAGPAGGPVLDAAAREELVRQAAGKSTREVQQMLAEVDPELARPSDRLRALGGGRWELKAAVDAECRHGLEKLLMLLSHRDPHLTLGGLVARLVRDGLDRYDPARPPRVRRTGARRSGAGERSANTLARRDTEAVERSAARADGGGVERQSEVERDDASFGAAVRNGTVRPSAAQRPAEAEHGETKSAPAHDGGGRTASPAKRDAEAERGGAKSAAVRDIVRRSDSAAQRHTEAECGGANSVSVRDTVRGSDSAPKRPSEAEQGSTKSAPVRSRDGHTTSLAKRHSVTGHGNASRAAAPNSGVHTTSPTKCRSEAEPGRRTHAVARHGGGPAVAAAKRDTEAERGSPMSAPVRDTLRRSESPAKRDTEAKRGGPMSAPARDTLRRSESAAKRDTEAERGSPKSAPARDTLRRSESPAKRDTEPERGGPMSAPARDTLRRSESAAKRDTEAERDGPKSAPARDTLRRSESPAKGVRQDEGVHTGEAARRGAGAAWAPGRGRETEHGCGQPRTLQGNGGWGAAPTKRHGKAAGDGRDVGVHGVLERATGAHGPGADANRRNPSWAPVPGDRRFPALAAQRLAYAAGLGAVGPAERSPAVQRHLAALRSLGAAPGSRSRYIPAAVKREVWRRDQGCCSYVDRHGGRRCGSRYRLEIDHVVPFALGGGAEPANLRLRCEAHHRLRHAQRHDRPARIAD